MLNQTPQSAELRQPLDSSQPIYFSQNGEARSRLTDFKNKKLFTVDLIAIINYLFLRYTVFDETIFTEIRKIPPGYVLNKNKFILTKPLVSENKKTMSWCNATKKIKTLVYQSPKSQIVDKNSKILLSLSGGLDSTITLSVLKQNGYSVSAFSAGFPNVNEFTYAEQAALDFGIPLEKVVLDNLDYLTAIRHLPKYLSEPIGGLDIPRFAHALEQIATHTNENYSTLAMGIAADEIFNGYGRWIKFDNKEANFFSIFFEQNTFNSVRVLKKCTNIDIEGHKKYLQKKLSTLSFWGSTKLQYQTKNRIANIYIRLPGYEGIAFATIARSLGMNFWSPFLKDKLIRLSFQMSESFHNFDGIEKRILRDAVKDFIPDQFRLRPKQDFTESLDLWVSEEYYQEVLQVVTSGSVSKLEIFKPAAVEKLLRQNNKKQNTFFLRVLILEYFLKT